VREHFPEQLEAYKRRYAGSAFVSSAYRERMAALVDQICREFKLGKRHMYEDSAKEPIPQVIEIQPWLPFAPSRAPQSQDTQSQATQNMATQNQGASMQAPMRAAS
jgi:hypothetical protein